MAQSKRHLILMMLSAILVVARGETYEDFSEERGLTPSCINRVIATCGSFQSSQEVEDMEDSRGTKAIFEEMKAVRVVLEELVKKITLQDFVILDVQKSLNNLELKMVERDNSEKIKELQDFNTEKIGTIDGKEHQDIQDTRKSPQTPLDVPRNCADLLKDGDTESGIRNVYPYTCCKHQSISVLCDQETDGGGWTVFQRRDALPERENFFRGWEDYRHGFGNLTGEFWLGLDNIHALVSATQMELRVDLEDFHGQKKWAKYDNFSIENASQIYQLHVGGYSGDVKDDFTYHNGRFFTTKDQDNDDSPKENCAQLKRGAWWYGYCGVSNLNGWPYEGENPYYDGIYWYGFQKSDYYSLKTTEMKVRPEITN